MPKRFYGISLVVTSREEEKQNEGKDVNNKEHPGALNELEESRGSEGPRGSEKPKEPEESGEEVEERAQWSNSTEFLMSCIAMSVGLGNIWRFPYIAYQNGGGAFIIPYIIVLIIVGKPMYFLEMILGQFSSKSSLKVWCLSPFFKGIGIGQLIGLSCVITYYCSMIGLVLHYLISSFQAELPWSHCRKEWGNNCVDSKPNSAQSNITDGVSSSEYYFKKEVLNIKDDISDGIGAPNLELSLWLLLTWILIVIIISKGVQSSGKVSYFLAIFPYIVIITLLIRAATLEGARDGIIFFIRPQFSELIKPKWMTDLVDHFGGTFLIFALAVFEMIAICWVYGTRNIVMDTQFMCKRYVSGYWRYCWCLITPLFMAIVFVYYMITQKPLKFGKKDYPDKYLTGGWCLFCIGLVQLPIWAFYTIGCRMRNVKESFRPTHKWGPKIPKYHREWKAFKADLKERNESISTENNYPKWRKALRKFFAFIIPYIIVLIIVGKPMYFLEMILGQFSSKSSLKVWCLSPFFKGIGIGQLIGLSCVITYYCSMIGLVLHYLISSFQAELPWSRCRKEWGSNCVDSRPNPTHSNITDGVSSSEYYFKKEVLNIKDDISDGIGAPNLELSLWLLLTWILIVIIISKGVQSSGKVSYFLAIFPYIVIITLLIRAATLEGARDGIIFFIRPQFSELIKPKWMTDLVDHFGGTFLIFALAVFEMIAICWVYGTRNIVMDTQFMCKKYVSGYWRYCWCLITPLFMAIVFVYYMITQKPLKFGKKDYPDNYLTGGWCLFCIGLVQLPIWAFYTIGCRMRNVKESFRPTHKWGPKNPKFYRKWKEFKADLKERNEVISTENNYPKWRKALRKFFGNYSY
uniref:Transporter n=1 Tax=Lutzomyia longipalpis TaxID=7200 RepID=A0A1B0CAR2_LUTLO